MMGRGFGAALSWAFLVLSGSAALGQEVGEPRILIEAFQDGAPIVEGATVSGVLQVRVTVEGAVGQHDQYYANFVPIFPRGHHSHNLPSEVSVRRLDVDTAMFLDGENLISVHVHPHNKPSEAIPYNARFAFGTFKIVTSNENPAPNGDVLLPTLAHSPPVYHMIDGVKASAAIQDDTDDDAFAGGGGQLIAHLGSSVMGRGIWQDIMFGAKVIPFMRDETFTGRVVYFFADSVGRANYATVEFSIPPVPVSQAENPLPPLNAKILNAKQGDEIVVPDGGSFILQVRIDNVKPDTKSTKLQTWVGNLRVRVTDLAPYLSALQPGDTSFVVDVPIDAAQIQALEAPRTSGHLGATAFAVWNDFSPDGDNNFPTADHIHLRSIRTAGHGGAPSVTAAASAAPTTVVSPSRTAALSVSVSDDGQPSPLSYTWSVLSGPGPVSFLPNGTSGSDATTATFSGEGRYDLQVSASDGNFEARSTVTVLVVPASPSGFLSAEPGTLDFGAIPVGGASSLQVTLRNDGSAPVSVSSIVSGNPAFAHDATLPLSVPAYSEQAFGVTFSPGAEAGENGVLTITSDADDNPTLAVSLSGTGGIPALVPSPTSLTVSASASESVVRTVTLSNPGSAPLSWSLSRPLKGTEVTELVLPSSQYPYYAAAFDGTQLWQPSGVAGSDTLYRLNPSDGSLLGTLTHQAGTIKGLTWDGTSLVSTNPSQDKIHFINPATGAVTRSLDAPDGISPNAVAFGGGILWVCNSAYRLFKLDPADGSILEEWDMFSLLEYGSIDRIVYFDDALWVTKSGGSTAYKLLPENGRAVAVLSRPSNYDRLWTHDGQGGLWWFNTISNRAHRVETGDHSWLEASAPSGTIPPGSSVDLELTIDVEDAGVGSGSTSLTIASDDPAQPVTTIPVTVNVTGAPPGHAAPVLVSGPTATPNPATRPGGVALSVSATDDGQPAPLIYTWSRVSGPGDVTYSENGVETSDSVSATFSAPGTYVIRVSVYDGSLTTTGDVAVAVLPNERPVAVAGVSVVSGTIPLAVDFDGSGSSDPDGTVASYTWDFGDGAVANGATVSHTYTAPGVYEAQLTVADNAGALAGRYVTITVLDPGSVLREVWSGVSGALVSDLTAAPGYPDSPSSVDFLSTFSAPVDWADNYGTRVRGFVRPVVTGFHVFWIASDNSSELWLSTDATPANRALIARVDGDTAPQEWGKDPLQQSGPIWLEAGNAYYVEALHKEDAGGDHLAVGWRLPGGTLERPIPSSRLVPFQAANQPPVASLTAPLDGTTVASTGAIVLAADASDPDGFVTGVEFFAGGTSLGTDGTSPYGLTWSGAPPGSHVLTAVATDDGGASATSSGVTVLVNSPPVAQGQSVSTPYDTAVAVTLAATDADGHPLSFAVTIQPANGTLTGTAPNLTYTPMAGYSGADSFTFKANDGFEDGPVAVVSLTVEAPPGAGAFQQDSGADGLLAIEVEHYEILVNQGGHTWSPNASTGYSGEGALEATPNTGALNNTGYETASPRLDFQVQFVKTGTHYVWVRGIGPSGSDDSCHVGLDGLPNTTADRISSFGTGWTWSKATMDSADATLDVASAGLRTLNVWMREDGFILDKIVLTTNGAYVPTGNGPPESSQGGGGNAAPSVAITSPADGASYAEPASITITADATDPDGSVTKVEFFQGSTLLGEDVAAPFSFVWSGVAAGTYTLQVVATDNQGATASDTVGVSVAGGAPPGSGTGLTGAYHDAIDFTSLVLTRTDTTVDFDWGSGSPAPGVGADTFSVRWTGQVEAQYGETYTFYTLSDDGIRLWVNGQLLVDNWTNHGPTENSGSIALIAGQKVDLQLDYYEDGGGAVAKLSWSSFQTPKQIIPQSQLYPAGPTGPPTVTIAASDPDAAETGADPGEFLFTRFGDTSADLTVEFVRGGTAEAGSDYGMIPDRVVIPAGASSVTLPIATIDDTLEELAETVILAVSADPAYVVGSPDIATVTITDDDLPVLTVTVSDPTGSEEGSDVARFVVTRAGLTTSPLFYEGTLTGSATNGLDYQNMTFPGTIAGGQSIAQVTVIPLDDSLVEGEETVVFTLEPGAGYVVGTPSSAVVTIADNDSSGTLPPEWATADVGAVGSAGSAGESGGTFTIQASGTDIWGSSDQFHFVHQQMTGDGEIEARVLTLVNTNAWAKAGVMMRETLDPSSAHAMMIVTPSNGVSFQRRPVTAAASEHTTLGGFVAPTWVRLVRQGADFTAYRSDDGAAWTLVGTRNIPMTATIYVGLAVTSHDNVAVTTAEFDNVTLTIGGSNQPPAVTLTSPSEGATFVEGEDITLTANPSDPDGTITRVEFFQGVVKLGEASAAPWEFVWSGAAAGSYALTAQATDDGLATTLSPPVGITIDPPPAGSGTVLREWWTGISGTAVSALTGSPNYPNSPSGSDEPTIFEAPVNWADTYGTRMRGYVHPPTTGNYVFWVSGDDNCELWLSTNDDPANRVLIATVPGWTSSRQWDKYPAQQSTPIALTAGNRYFIEALQKEGGGGDNLAVGWQLPDTTLERPIPGGRLSPFVVSSNAPPTVNLTSPTQGATFTEPADVTLTATASDSDGSVTRVEFFEGATLLGQDTTSPYSFNWSGVAAGSYTLTAIAFDDGGGQTSSTGVGITVQPPASPGAALFVVGNTTLNASDAAIQSRLVGLGYTVTVVDGPTSVTGDSAGMDVIVISSTVSSGTVNTKFTTVAVPVINWESHLLDDLGMTGLTASTDYGTIGTQTDLAIVDPAHPMASGLSGTVTVLSTADVFMWGVPNGNAEVVATLSGDPGRATLFGYDSGAAMPGLTAPARRVGFFLNNSTGANLNGTGWPLFDEAVAWAVSVGGASAQKASSTSVPPPPSGADITIDGKGSYTTLQEAIDAATAGETIVLGPMRFYVPAGIVLPGGVSLRGNAPHLTILDGQGAGTVVRVTGTPVDGRTTLEQLTVTRGGVGVDVGAADVLLRNLQVVQLAGNGIVVAQQGRLEGVSLTVADNGGHGFVLHSPDAWIRGSLSGRNAGEGVSAVPGATVAYSATFENRLGTNNQVGGIEFVDALALDYRIAPGSASIDAGDPADPSDNELVPNGGRINQGAFGNTPYAAPSSVPSPARPSGDQGRSSNEGACGATGLECLLVLVAIGLLRISGRK